MRRATLPLLIAFALMTGLDTAVAADPLSPPDAQAAAKKKAGKKKAAKCPAKPKKGKKKAGKSLAESAAKKKKAKGKKKAAKCKPKPKKKAKGKPAPKPTPKPAPPAAFTLADGLYGDPTAFNELRVSGTTATLRSDLSCFLYNSPSVPLTFNGNTAQASGDHDMSVVGEPAHVKWSLTIQSTLDYKLQISWDVANGICKSEKTVNGKFSKV